MKLSELRVLLVIVIAQVPGIYGSKQTKSEGVAEDKVYLLQP